MMIYSVYVQVGVTLGGLELLFFRDCLMLPTPWYFGAEQFTIG